MGVATDCSMVSASAPVYVVVRFTCGGRIWGNCAIGSPRRATAPTRTVMIAMTIATIGRLMKNADTVGPPLSSVPRRGGGRRRGARGPGCGRPRRFRRRLRHDGCAVGHLLHAFDDDAIA